MRRSAALISVSTAAACFLLILGGVALSQTETPPPYAGLKNPFPWNDASATEAGKTLYRQSCQACHGDKGANIASANFSRPDFPRNLEQRPDFYFWILSEGRLDKGMPPFKSSLSEEQRWQLVTYLWSLGQQTPPGTTTPTGPAPIAGTIGLSTPEKARAGEPLTLTATLLDSQNKPVGNATIRFFARMDFFAKGLMEIGDASTDGRGVATLSFTPRQDGTTEIIARMENMEATATINVASAASPLYRPEAGIKLPTLGPEVFIGPESSHELEDGSNAPTSALRLPGGVTSWLLLFAIIVATVWSTYFRVIYQLFRIPVRREIRDTDTRLVPIIGLAFVTAVGLFLVLKIVTGPYSHLHLLP